MTDEKKTKRSRAEYIPGFNEIPEDRYANNFVTFDDQVYLLGDLRRMGWTEESFLPGHASDIFLFWQATNQPKEEEGGGLKFVALTYVQGDVDLDPDGAELRPVAYGYGYFDGVRHMYMGEPDSECGYVHSPAFGLLSKLMSRLKELQDLYCRDVEDRF